MLEYMTIAELTAAARSQNQTISETVLADQSAQTEIPAQELTAPAREGFTVVEWGGTEIK